MKKINFEILQNADNNTIEYIAEKYSIFDDETKKSIFNLSKIKYEKYIHSKPILIKKIKKPIIINIDKYIVINHYRHNKLTTQIMSKSLKLTTQVMLNTLKLLILMIKKIIINENRKETNNE